MIKVSTVAIAGGTLLMAAGVGMYMQMGHPAGETGHVGAILSAPEVEANRLPHEATAPEALNQTPLELDSIKLTSSDMPLLPDRMTAESGFPETPVLASVDETDLMETPASPAVAPLTGENSTAIPDVPEAPLLASVDDDEMLSPSAKAANPLAATDCPVDLTGETRAAAMVELHLSAPCQPSARVVIKHEGMSFSALTDEKGELTVEVPALAESATFFAMMQDGNGAAVELNVDTLGFYDRSVITWHGDTGVELHALEFGASYDDAGHVWSGAPREPSIAALGEGGFMTRLGDPALPDGQTAEVYTFPTGTAKTGGEIEMSVEVEVTAANCGRDMSADVIEVTEGKPTVPEELKMTLPGCDAVGDFIQLKNIVPDLKIASR